MICLEMSKCLSESKQLSLKIVLHIYKDRTRNNRQITAQGFWWSIGGILYEESDCLLQKFMISLGKQLLELYDLFETSVGLGPAEGWEEKMKAFLAAFLALEDCRFCYWIALFVEALGKDKAPTHWERIWKAWSRGKGFVSGELVSYGRSSCNWKEIMTFWEPEFLRDNYVINFQHKSCADHPWGIRFYPVWVWIWHNPILIFLVIFRYFNSECERQRLWGMHEGYLWVFTCNQCMIVISGIIFLWLILAAKTTQTFLTISYFSNYLVLLKLVIIPLQEYIKVKTLTHPNMTN